MCNDVVRFGILVLCLADCGRTGFRSSDDPGACSTDPDCADTEVCFQGVCVQPAVPGCSDALSADRDSDGVCDADDPCPLDNPDDSDGDRVCDTDDPCPLDNPDDSDSDGLCDADDPCPFDNPDDSDGDTVCDTDDNCPYLANQPQTDSNSDGVGDACSVARGVLDASFSDDGEFLLPWPGNDYGRFVLAMPDGSIFVAGGLSNGADSDLLLLKLTEEGAVDTSFQGVGYISRGNLAGGNGTDVAWWLSVASDGDLLVSGTSEGPAGTQGVLWKVSPEGADDTSFGTGGTALLDDGDCGEFRAMVDTVNNGIYAVATMYLDTNTFYPAAWRLLGDGSGLDPGFQHPSQGILYDLGRGYNNLPLNLPNGTSMVAGSCAAAGWSGWNACSWLLDSQGNLVSAYGDDGMLIHGELAGGSNNDEWNAAVAYTNDRVVLCGASDSVASNQDEVIARIHSDDGSFDTSFGGGDGYWTEDVMGEDRLGRVNDCIVQVDGGIVAALEIQNGTDWDVAVIRLDASGERDLAFGDAGVLVLGGMGTEERHPRVVEQENGRVLVVTEQSGTDSDIVVWRIR